MLPSSAQPPPPSTQFSHAARLRLWALSLAFAGALSACGGGDDSPAPVPPAPTPTPAPSPAPTPAPAVERKLPQVWPSGAPDVLTDTQRVDGSMNDGAPLPAPLSLVASASQLPNITQEGLEWSTSNLMRSGRGLAADGSFVYLDRLAMQIVRVAPTGELRTQPSPGRPAGEAAKGFWNPTAFALDAQGNAFVADGWYPPDRAASCTVPCVGASQYPMGAGAWAGVWKITPDGAMSRVSGVVSGDALPEGMRDGDRDTARFSAITSMVAGKDGQLFVVDRQRKVFRADPNPALTEYTWGQYAVRRIAADGAVSTVLPLQDEAVSLHTRDDGRVVYLLDKLEHDAATGQAVVDKPADLNPIWVMNVGDDPWAWRKSADSVGNTWVMSSFQMGPPATGLPNTLRLFAVTRYGADGAFRPGSLLLHWGCTEQPINASPVPGLVDTCQFTQLGVARDQLYGLINNALVRVDVQRLLPK